MTTENTTTANANAATDDQAPAKRVSRKERRARGTTVAPASEVKAKAEEQALKDELARLKGLLAAAQKQSSLSIKVSAKGAVSVYGMGRFPTTLYAGQWQRLLAMGDAINQFIEDHKDELSWSK